MMVDGVGLAAVLHVMERVVGAYDAEVRQPGENAFVPLAMRAVATKWRAAVGRP